MEEWTSRWTGQLTSTTEDGSCAGSGVVAQGKQGDAHTSSQNCELLHQTKTKSLAMEPDSNIDSMNIAVARQNPFGIEVLGVPSFFITSIRTMNDGGPCSSNMERLLQCHRSPHETDAHLEPENMKDC
eukprot:CAMPEP_0114255858 /NCGR_PEP_ID=MMETSP0058-20121206/17815_1 /TAXON_ID=36894 /ORGANISM="Pyramimonas parkeae, CCMP726" /LENGTH=127 /DNA_ID=CAMNT_0001370329 /DNA_START=601 /DNA_END=984 /DNA_ORIENTATION=-